MTGVPSCTALKKVEAIGPAKGLRVTVSGEE